MAIFCYYYQLVLFLLLLLLANKKAKKDNLLCTAIGQCLGQPGQQPSHENTSTRTGPSTGQAAFFLKSFFLLYFDATSARPSWDQTGWISQGWISNKTYFFFNSCLILKTIWELEALSPALACLNTHASTWGYARMLRRRSPVAASLALGCQLGAQYLNSTSTVLPSSSYYLQTRLYLPFL